ncbi:hypothetical protein FKM82_026876 [Ascaphus truei]
MARNLTPPERRRLERHLFHGTGASVVEAICRQNFDPLVCRKHRTKYGKGCYFTKLADFAHLFATANSDGHHYMFLAKVLVGSPAVGLSHLRRPPPQCPDDPNSPLYDSCMSDLNDPKSFIIFDSEQCYPYFIIKYQKMEGVVIVD